MYENEVVECVELKLTKDEAILLEMALMEAIEGRHACIRDCKRSVTLPHTMKEEKINDHGVYIFNYRHLKEKILEAGA